MVKVSETYCDIKYCSKLSFKDNLKLPVVFTTNQEDGKQVDEPYIEMLPLDLCREHYEDFIFTTPLTASGAMGHNDYHLDVKINKHSFGKDKNEPA